MHQKIQDWGLALLTLAIGVLSFVAVLLFLWHIEGVTPWAEMGPGDWGVWVGSIGTLGALGGTIYLATNQNRERDRRERIAAELYAESILTRVQELTATIQTLLEQIHRHKDSAISDKFMHWCVNHLLTQQAWEIDDIARITPLSKALAVNMARASAMLKIIHAVHNPNLRTNDFAFSEDDIKLLVKVLSALNRYLGIIDRQLKEDRKYILR
ncbi:hypothetical protein [Massilia timonae]|uniref:hypothetical protein n=1 Tax=Massilia timonae TaxID=47229 RepID=UPI0028A74A74|nr:hypothetical protein [Massilia timonae]